MKEKINSRLDYFQFYIDFAVNKFCVTFSGDRCPRLLRQAYFCFGGSLDQWHNVVTGEAQG